MNCRQHSCIPAAPGAKQSLGNQKGKYNQQGTQHYVYKATGQGSGNDITHGGNERWKHRGLNNCRIARNIQYAVLVLLKQVFTNLGIVHPIR